MVLKRLKGNWELFEDLTSAVKSRNGAFQYKDQFQPAVFGDDPIALFLLSSPLSDDPVPTISLFIRDGIDYLKKNYPRITPTFLYLETPQLLREFPGSEDLSNTKDYKLFWVKDYANFSLRGYELFLSKIQGESLSWNRLEPDKSQTPPWFQITRRGYAASSFQSHMLLNTFTAPNPLPTKRRMFRILVPVDR